MQINLTEQQVQALNIVQQLLEVGEFRLNGKDLEVASTAKSILKGLLSSIQAPQEEEAPASTDD